VGKNLVGETVEILRPFAEIRRDQRWNRGSLRGTCYQLSYSGIDCAHSSVLPEFLAPIGPLHVSAIEDDTPVEANHFYVILSNATLTIADGRLHLAKPLARRGLRTPIDTFFVSLAEERTEKAASSSWRARAATERSAWGRSRSTAA